MPCGVNRTSYRANVADDAGRSFIVYDEDSLDAMLTICAQRLFDAFWRRTRAPLLVLDRNVKTDALSKIDPQMAELTEARRQDFVTWRKGVAECCFPTTRAARGEDEYLSGRGLEDFLERLEQPQS
jgi:hypothetical protein